MAMQIPESWLRSWINPPLGSDALAELFTMAGLEVEAIDSIDHHLTVLVNDSKKDKRLTFKITPNRGDCLSIKGLGREISALTGQPYQAPSILPIPNKHANVFPVYIEARNACGRYIGRIVKRVNLQEGHIPDWMKYRLLCCGLPFTSTIVDIGNYVMLELGQPLHLFDATKIKGSIYLRMAKPNESLYCLNDKIVQLDQDMLVVADDKEILALAGVIGGMTSRVTVSTQDIFLESAFFDQLVVADKARQLGIFSEAAYRFERGVDSALQCEAIERVTALIIDIFGGHAGPIIEKNGDLRVYEPITLRCQRVTQLLGITMSYSAIADILARLGLHFVQDKEVFRVDVPSFRTDLKIEEDLIEEIARLYGYDNIPAITTSSSFYMPARPNNEQEPKILRRLLISRGYQEAISYVFVKESLEKHFSLNEKPILILNPIDSQANIMRSTLLGSLVVLLAENISRQHLRVRLFEIANIFSQKNQQQEKLALLAWGYRYPEQWGCLSETVDFYDVKSDIEALMVPKNVQFIPAKHPAMHHSRCANIVLSGHIIGVLGELSPQLVKYYKLPSAPILGEIDFRVLCTQVLPVASIPSKFPLVKRDLALVIDKACSSKTVLDAMQISAPDIVQSIQLFDIYSGTGIKPDKKSIAYRIYLQAADRTLLEEDIKWAMAILLEAAQKKGASLRD